VDLGKMKIQNWSIIARFETYGRELLSRPKGIVVSTEDKVTVEQRKNYKLGRSFLYFIPWNIYHLNLLKQKSYTLFRQHFT
jgi:hypothetical protein